MPNRRLEPAFHRSRSSLHSRAILSIPCPLDHLLQSCAIGVCEKCVCKCHFVLTLEKYPVALPPPPPHPTNRMTNLGRFRNPWGLLQNECPVPFPNLLEPHIGGGSEMQGTLAKCPFYTNFFAVRALSGCTANLLQHSLEPYTDKQKRTKHNTHSAKTHVQRKECQSDDGKCHHSFFCVGQCSKHIFVLQSLRISLFAGASMSKYMNKIEEIRKSKFKNNEN